MAKPCFFEESLSLGDRVVVLGEEETRHLRAARRLGVGDQVKVLNGAGVIAIGVVRSVSRRDSEIEIQSTSEVAQPATEITIAVAIPKADRQRFMVEALVQLGVSRIVPLDCDYSAIRPDHKSVEKWPRFAREAAKQSGNPWLVQLALGSELQDALENPQWSESETRWVADAGACSKLTTIQSFTRHLVAIGPEGGFSTTEQDLIRSLGVKSIQLGPHILRTETAAIAAAAQLAACLNEI